MTKPLQLVIYDVDNADVAYRLEYVNPIVADNYISLFQMLHNGTADLDLVPGAVNYADYEFVAFAGSSEKYCYYFYEPLQEPIVYTEFLLDTFPWIYYVYLTLGIAAISIILKISQHERVESMLIEWPLRLLAVALRQPAFDRFSRNVRLSGLVAAAAGLLPFTIFAMYFDLNIKLLLAVPFQHRPPIHSIDELIHAMKYGGYKYVTHQNGFLPVNFSTPKQTTELETLADRFVIYPPTDFDDIFRSVSDPTLKQVSMGGVSWSDGHCADVLLDSSDPTYLLVKIKGVTPRLTGFPMRRELYKERERLNRALALVQPVFISLPLKYSEDMLVYSLKLNPKYNNTVRLAQYRSVLIFFGAIYLGCILVVFLEIFLHKTANRLRMWRTLSTAHI